MTAVTTMPIDSRRVDSARASLEHTLRHYGATGFAYAWDTTHTAVEFVLAARQIRFIIPLPRAEDFDNDSQGRVRHISASRQAYENAVANKIRTVTAMVRTKFEAVSAGVTSLEAEFLGHIVMPSGGTVFDEVTEQVTTAYATGEVTPLMLTH